MPSASRAVSSEPPSCGNCCSMMVSHSAKLSCLGGSTSGMAQPRCSSQETGITSPFFSSGIGPNPTPVTGGSKLARVPCGSKKPAASTVMSHAYWAHCWFFQSKYLRRAT